MFLFIDQSFRNQGGWIIIGRKINPICMSKPRSQQVLEKSCSIYLSLDSLDLGVHTGFEFVILLLQPPSGS